MRHLILSTSVLLGVGCGTVGLDPYGHLDGPRLDILPESDEVNFGAAPSESGSTYEEIILLSAGDESVWIEEVFLEGDDADEFLFANSLPLPHDLPPDAEMPIKVFFEPTAIGTFRANLTVFAEGWEMSRSLMGTGCEPDDDGGCSDD